MRLSTRAVVLMATLGVASGAWADGFALHRYEPTPAGAWFFARTSAWSEGGASHLAAWDEADLSALLSLDRVEPLRGQGDALLVKTI